MKPLRSAALVAAGVVGSGVVGGLTYAAVSTPATASSNPAPQPAAASAASAARPHAGMRLGRHMLLNRLEHGQLTLQTRTGERTVDLQRGAVTAVSPTSISVRSHDGTTGTYAVTPTTRIRVAGALTTIGKVHSGDTVFVVASGGTALRVLDRAR